MLFTEPPFENLEENYRGTVNICVILFFLFCKIKKNIMLGKITASAGSLFLSSKLAMDLVLEVKRQTQKEGK